MAYADYTYYSTEFLGNKVPETDFPRAAARASEYLDSITAGIITKLQEIPEEVKKATCAIAEKEYSKEQGQEVVSESVGSYSVTYKDAQTPYEKELYNIAKRYLGHTGLMYRGI